MSGDLASLLAEVERMAAAGDAREALARLAPRLADPEPPARALWVAGELAEQAGQPARARAFFERLLALDVDYPGARERVAHLGEPVRAAAMDGGTLLAYGALATERYRVVRELGRGAAGTVLLSEDQHTGRRVALKLYHRRGRADRERLRREGRVPAGLEHQGVIRVFDLEPELGALVMEVADGGSLAGALRVGGYGSSELRAWMDGLAEALAFVHGQGWVHRDLKPSNLLVRRGRVVITDFGLAAPPGAVSDAARAEGSRGYMAPEQERGAPVSEAADVHAVGATLEALLEGMAGRAPAAWTELAAVCRHVDPAARPSVARIRECFA